MEHISKTDLPICFYSSFIFITNAVIAFYYKYYKYGFLFSFLFITSIIVHSNNDINSYAMILDKINILIIIIYGGYVFYKKSLFIENAVQYLFSIIIISCFLLTIYLYCYGYFFKSYCFYNDIDLANYYQSVLHYISSFGHHLIVLL